MIGNSILLGKPPKLAVWAYAILNGTSDIILYSNPDVYDSRFFSKSDNNICTYTCRRAGTYKITAAGKGQYNGGGTSVTANYYVRKNGVNILTYTGAPNAFGSSHTVTTTLAVGDVITLCGKKSNAGTVSAGLIIEVA